MKRFALTVGFFVGLALSQTSGAGVVGTYVRRAGDTMFGTLTAPRVNVSGMVQATVFDGGIFQSNAANTATAVNLVNESCIKWPDTKFCEVGTTATITAASTNVTGILGVGNNAVLLQAGGGYQAISSNASNSYLFIAGNKTSSGTAFSVDISSTTNLTTSGDKIVRFSNNNGASEKSSIDKDGAFAPLTSVISSLSFTDDSATTGSRTVNKICGLNAFAGGATTITITNSFVTATSVVFCTINTNDATATLKNCVAGAGSFVATITAAATGTTKLAWCVLTP